MNAISQHYLYFTSKEKSGIMFLLLVICMFSFLPLAYPFMRGANIFEASVYEKEISTLAFKKSEHNYNNVSRYEKNFVAESSKEENNVAVASLFYFDPNTLSAEGWVKLGIKEKTANTIQKYVSKGGKFRQAEDIAKIWGLNEADVKRLVPYVRIQAQEEKISKENFSYERKFSAKKNEIKLDVNLADTSMFIALPGIGAGFAKRIVNFRNRLGGFYSVEQVAETYGLPDSTFQIIKPLLYVKAGNIKQININTASLEDLKAHPYIRYNLANVIINYRNQHGNFATVEDIKKIMILEDEVYVKLQPYLTVQK